MVIISLGNRREIVKSWCVKLGSGVATFVLILMCLKGKLLVW